MNVLDEERRVPSLDMSLKQLDINGSTHCTLGQRYIQIPHRVVHVTVDV